MTNCKIYFAGSIKGGREDAAIYSDLIMALIDKNYFVLTPHVGDLKLSNEGETKFKANEVYLRDMSLLRQADFLVAEISTPSHGVGYEIGFAEAADIPIICLIQKSKKERVSAIIAGNPKVNLIEYETILDAISQIEYILCKQ